MKKKEAQLKLDGFNTDPRKIEDKNSVFASGTPHKESTFKIKLNLSQSPKIENEENLKVKNTPQLKARKASPISRNQN